MRDLEFFELPLGKITLERFDVYNERHMKAIDGLRDFSAKRLCYDLKQDVYAAKRGSLAGNSFLVKNDEDDYFGYMHISNDHDGERVLSCIVQKEMRGKGYGKIILTSVSDYLLNSGIASSLKLYIKPQNVASAKVAVSCGFEANLNSAGENSGIYSRKI